jgi:uncharacterized protein DUF349
MPFTRLKPLSGLFRSAAPNPEPPAQTPVELLEDGESLRDLAGLRPADSAAGPSGLERITQQRLAQQRMAQLIDAGAIDFSGLCASAGNSAVLLAVAGFCSDPAHLSQALALIEDHQAIAKLVTDGSSSRLRQLAAQRIQDPEELRQLLKQTRDKDKSVYKILKQKSDALHEEQLRLARIESDVAALCASLEQHAQRRPDAAYAGSFERLEARWRTLGPEAAMQLRQRAEHALARCREVMADHARQMEQQAAEEMQRAAQEAERAQAIAAAQATEEIESRQRQELAAAAAAEAAARRAAQIQARADKLAAEAAALRQIGGLIGKTHAALREGHTGRAAGLRRAIEEKLASAPALPVHLSAQLQQLDLKLNELKQWKDYAVAPKRAELIEEMEALIGSAEEPKALADRIKQLQEDWKTISKGVVIDSEADWQRFHQAAETAYQPCRAYFEAQAKVRQSNLKQRRDVIERLKVFEHAQSGEHPDWRAVAAVLREAQQEWRRHFPVERAPGLKLQEEFDAVIGRLQVRLDAWHGKNAADKSALIERAQHARTQNGPEAMDAVKRLQMQWREIGPAQRDLEQRLWEEFRELCDAVYQKRQQALAEYSAGLEANVGQAAALCAQAEQAAQLMGPELLAAAAKIPEWRSAFAALGEIPKTEQRALQQRFERALKLCATALSRDRARAKAQSFADLLEAAGLIQAYAWAVSQDAAASDRDALKQAAETFIAGVQTWPKGGAQALQEAWARAEGNAIGELAAHETALRTLCIRNEIAADLPTPPEDHALRRDYQMQRLVSSMGQRREPSSDDRDALSLEWVRVGPIEPATRDALLARFLRAR